MKKMSDLMAEMGFRKDAPDSVKEAFLKHLIKSATGVDVETPSEKKAKSEKALPARSANKELFPKAQVIALPEQLSFEFFKETQGKPAKVS